nr:immunoglobulin light chain junction region [Macaca mulatta]MPN80087.1 immunoglobulin light chain junction region [Macaca mulatta]MPN80365.1 immunoglobulin light chain junction region [Macaca mulatta]MPN80499.1 immunoglobulin light chain junction region [Macaca mulatta]MPN81353.1 immunoglobulin light chain junction region [Macaca mulatta]
CSSDVGSNTNYSF